MMRDASYRMTRRTAPRRLWCTTFALLVAMLMTGLVFAQPTPSNTPAAKKPLPNPRQRSSGKAKADRAAARAGRAAKKNRRKPMVMDKDAVWSCENTKIALEPSWRSTKAIECSWDIRNDGMAPLHIKAKGG